MEWETLTVGIQDSDLPDLSIVEDSRRPTEENSAEITTQVAVTEHSIDTSDENDLYTTTLSPTDVVV